MKEDFVTYDIAVKLKEKGFKEYCEHGYFIENGRDILDTPTIYQVLKWLREEKKIHISTSLYGNEEGGKWNHAILDIETSTLLNPKLEKNYATCVESDLAGIEYVIDNLI